jgi:CDGSH-type Zn-finger protein
MTTSTFVARVEELIRRAEAPDQGGASERSRALATRLRSTVLRPLAALGDTLDRTTALESQTTGVQELLFELAIDLTRACATDQRAALLEACAGAHYLVIIGRDDAQERLTRLAEIARDVPGDPKGGIRVRENGPYLLTGGARMSNFLGEPTTAPPVAALCRCGRSESKPWCDGTHATIGFSATKHPDRVVDRLDSYAHGNSPSSTTEESAHTPDGALTRCPRCFASVRSRLWPRQAAGPTISCARSRRVLRGRSERRSPSAAPPKWPIGFARPRLRSRKMDRITPPVAWISGMTPATSRCDRQVPRESISPSVAAGSRRTSPSAVARTGADFHDPVIDRTTSQLSSSGREAILLSCA